LKEEEKKKSKGHKVLLQSKESLVLAKSEKQYFINHFEEIGWIDPFEKSL